MDAICQATGKPCEGGQVVISPNALEHVSDKHPEDWDEAVKVLQSALPKPTYYSPPKMGTAGLTVAYYYVILDQTGRAVVLPISTDRT